MSLQVLGAEIQESSGSWQMLFESREFEKAGDSKMKGIVAEHSAESEYIFIFLPSGSNIGMFRSRSD